MSRRPSLLGVEYVGGLKEESTAFAGVGAVAERALPRKRSPKGLQQEQIVESLVLLLIVAQVTKLLIIGFTPILAFPLEKEGSSSLPLEGES